MKTITIKAKTRELLRQKASHGIMTGGKENADGSWDITIDDDVDKALRVIINNTELKAIRKQLGMTTKEIAEAVDVSQRTYYGWEAGRPIPRIAIRAMAMLLWMDKGSRETFLNYVKGNDHAASNN